MEDMIIRFFENLVRRADGPMHIRLLLQPLMALIFAARAGIRDARANRSPYLWAMFTGRGETRGLLRECWLDVGKVFVAALLIDVVYQIVTIRWIYPGESLAMAIILAFIPYLVFRGLFTRLARLTREHAPRPEKHAA